MKRVNSLNNYVNDTPKFNNRFHCCYSILVGTHLPMSSSSSNYSVKLSLLYQKRGRAQIL